MYIVLIYKLFFEISAPGHLFFFILLCPEYHDIEVWGEDDKQTTRSSAPFLLPPINLEIKGPSPPRRSNKQKGLSNFCHFRHKKKNALLAGLPL